MKAKVYGIFLLLVLLHASLALPSFSSALTLLLTQNQSFQQAVFDYSLRQLRFRSYPNHTRIVLEATKPLSFSFKENKRQVVLIVKGGFLLPSIKRQEVGDGFIRSIEPKQEQDGVRLFIECEQECGQTKVFTLQEPDRIVVDLLRPTTNSPPAGFQQVLKTIAIDPGHGGRDAGAIGPQGLREKDVTMDIAVKLQSLLQERLPVQVIMTRTDDSFVSLEERAAIANRSKADVFISIHVNAAFRSQAVGFETYYLSYEPSDNDARASALRENLTLNLEGLTPREQESLKTILWDMAQTFHIKESGELAEIFLGEFDKILKVENRGVKSAPFLVLMGAAMPAVLVEVAFISNPSEERKLSDESYRQRIAEALYRGILKFKARYEKKVGMTPLEHPAGP